MLDHKTDIFNEKNYLVAQFLFSWKKWNINLIAKENIKSNHFRYHFATPFAGNLEQQNMSTTVLKPSGEINHWNFSEIQSFPTAFSVSIHIECSLFSQRFTFFEPIYIVNCFLIARRSERFS